MYGLVSGICVSIGLNNEVYANIKDQIDTNYTVEYGEDSKNLSKKLSTTGKVDSVYLDDMDVNFKKLGSYTTDLVVNRGSWVYEVPVKVEVVDSTAPKIVNSKKLEFNVFSKNKLRNYFTITDNHLVNQDSVKITGLNTNKIGKQTLTITAEDASGNKTVNKYKAAVKDVEAPKVTAGVYTITEGDSYDLLSGVKVSDNYTPEDNIKLKAYKNKFNANKAGTYTVKIEAIDSSGNKSSINRKVVVNEYVAPIIEDTVVYNVPNNNTTTNNVSSSSNSSNKSNNSSSSNSSNSSNNSTNNSTPKPIIQKNTITIAGVTLPVVNALGWGSAPAYGAGIWSGSLSTTDGAGGHIIGHNPGSFSVLFSVGIGSGITVVDGSGNSKTYYVYKIAEVNDDVYGRDGTDYAQEVFGGAGERIVLQTCINDYWNRIVFAR